MKHFMSIKNIICESDKFFYLEEEQTIVPVGEPTHWCAPIVLVPKPSNGERICEDLTRLNKNIQREFYPIPTLNNCLEQLKTDSVFSKLDANSGYWQI